MATLTLTHAVGLISWNTAGVRMARAMLLPWLCHGKCHSTYSGHNAGHAMASSADYHGQPRLATDTATACHQKVR